jgi:tetratricopeptide (TPR) repeat protein
VKKRAEMKRVSSEQYTVAWFTLAECVSRGEKERAFGVYRLLSHSLDDRALAIQLEGDLFCAFNMDSQAVERYQNAARAYKQVGRYLEAASVYEHIRTIRPYENECKEELLALYSTLQFAVRVGDLVVDLATEYVKQENYDSTLALGTSVDKLYSFGDRAWCYEAIMYVLGQQKNVPTHIRNFFAECATHAYLRHGDDMRLEHYIAKIKAYDEDLYAVVVATLKQEKV